MTFPHRAHQYPAQWLARHGLDKFGSVKSLLCRFHVPSFRALRSVSGDRWR